MICKCKIWDWKSFPSDILSTVSIMEGMNKRKYFYCAVKNFYHTMTFLLFHYLEKIYIFRFDNSLLDNVDKIINTKSRTFIQLNRMYWYSIKSYASYIWYIGLDSAAHLFRGQSICFSRLIYNVYIPHRCFLIS